MNVGGWSEPMVLRGLSGSVPSDSVFASYHKAPGSEREYVQVHHSIPLAMHAVLVSFLIYILVSLRSDLTSFSKYCCSHYIYPLMPSHALS